MTAGQLPALVPMSEKEWQAQVTDLAELCGWSWAHWRPARTSRGWRTPVSGPLGQGFPDLLVVHPERRHVLLVELKADGRYPTPEQRHVHDVLRAAGLGVHVWHPKDWPAVVAALQEPAADRRERAVPRRPRGNAGWPDIRGGPTSHKGAGS